MEHYVLGIDAAWTAKKPSGVALLKLNKNGYAEIEKAGRSYEEFMNGLVQWDKIVKGSSPNINELINNCREHEYSISTIALDIPLSPLPIIKRRTAEHHVSKVYGKYDAATHSPTMTRPGKISSTIFQQLNMADIIFHLKNMNQIHLSRFILTPQ